jgi:DNA repair protein RecN (Recombination protein N)
VLCITHLPQIASYADQHLTVRKEVRGDRTETKVRPMEGTERLQELAEMIGGQRITNTTRAQAQELLDTAVSEFTRKTRPDSAPATRPGKNGEDAPAGSRRGVRK